MRDFHKYYIIPGTPKEVYRALVNPVALTMWTNEEVLMSEEIGSEFSLWGGNICGKNLEFEKNKKIVQQWFFGVQEEPSIVTLKVHEHKKGTSFEVHHTNIPEEDFNEFSLGWTDMYVASLIDFFEEE